LRFEIKLAQFLPGGTLVGLGSLPGRLFGYVFSLALQPIQSQGQSQGGSTASMTWISPLQPAARGVPCRTGDLQDERQALNLPLRMRPACRSVP
jgi:hypothetical protein